MCVVPFVITASSSRARPLHYTQCGESLLIAPSHLAIHATPGEFQELVLRVEVRPIYRQAYQVRIYGTSPQSSSLLRI